MTRFSRIRRVAILLSVALMMLPAGTLWAGPWDSAEGETTFFQQWYQQLVEWAEKVESMWGGNEGGGFDPFGISAAAHSGEGEEPTSNFEFGSAEEE
ncbi:MAG: hypothetical protein AAF604_08610 [Acidobacteriota bacterium]